MSLSISSLIAIWVLLGMAFNILVLTTSFDYFTFKPTFLPNFFASAPFSQQPGPVLRTVLIPDLKSGIPQAVLIPAPVKNTPNLLFFIKSANSLHF